MSRPSCASIHDDILLRAPSYKNLAPFSGGYHLRKSNDISIASSEKKKKKLQKTHEIQKPYSSESSAFQAELPRMFFCLSERPLAVVQIGFGFSLPLPRRCQSEEVMALLTRAGRCLTLEWNETSRDL